MTTLASATIAALRATVDHLAGRVRTLSDEDLANGSGASEWSVAQVLSHLGSQAEIGLAGLRAAEAGEESPGQEFNESVWDRWNALTDRGKAEGFLEHSEALLAELEAIPADRREELTVKLGFLPFPLSLGAVVAMRLNEFALHGWDVEVGLDGTAEVDEEAASLVLRWLATEISFLIGYTAKREALPESAVVALPGVSMVVGEEVSLVLDGPAPTATFDGSSGAALRLLAGRLHDDVAVEGDVTLAQLRAAFPGY